MEIYPQDLGPASCQQIQRRRGQADAKGNSTKATAEPTTAEPKSRQRLRIESFRISHLFVLGIAFALASQVLKTTSWGLIILIVVFMIVVNKYFNPTKVRLSISHAAAAADVRRTTYDRLTAGEVWLLKQHCNDPVLQAYLELVGAAIDLPGFSGGIDTEKTVREAIRSLGSAIETLPLRQVNGISLDPAELERTAARMESDGDRETDAVVAASLHRRAEALAHQAETAARVVTLLRRNAALREELGDQIGALRTSLAAATLGQNGGVPELAGLAARIARIAQEAGAVTAARVEVDSLAADPYQVQIRQQ